MNGVAESFEAEKAKTLSKAEARGLIHWNKKEIERAIKKVLEDGETSSFHMPHGDIHCFPDCIEFNAGLVREDGKILDDQGVVVRIEGTTSGGHMTIRAYHLHLGSLKQSFTENVGIADFQTEAERAREELKKIFHVG